MIELKKSYIKNKFKIYILRYFYNLIYIYEYIRINKKLTKKKDLFLVYSIGKVGSSSIYETIRKQVADNAFHVHYLNINNIIKQKKYYKNSRANYIPLTILQSDILQKSLSKFGGKINIITLIREPISRELSSIFQDLLIFEDPYFYKRTSNLNNIIKVQMSKLEKKLPEENWFESELEQVFGVQLYKLNFDYNKRYIIYNKQKISFLLLRMEDLNEIGEKAFFEAFGEKVKMIRKNDSRNKYYHDRYISTKKTLSIEKNILDNIVNSAYYKKFYSDFITKTFTSWSK